MSIRRVRRRACHYYGGPGGTVDHVVPRSRGGTWDRWNLVPVCVPCNQLKADGPSPCSCDFCAEAVARHAGGGSPPPATIQPRARGNATDYFDQLMAERYGRHESTFGVG